MRASSERDWRTVAVTYCSTAQYGRFRQRLCRPVGDVSTARHWHNFPRNHYHTTLVSDNPAAGTATWLGTSHRNGRRRRSQQFGVSGVPMPAKSRPSGLLSPHTTRVRPIPGWGVRVRGRSSQSRDESRFFYQSDDGIPAHPSDPGNGSLGDTLPGQPRHERRTLGASGILRLQCPIKAAGAAMIFLSTRVGPPIFLNVGAATFSTRYRNHTPHVLSCINQSR